MKVSIVIPVYNEEKFIKKCLDSITAQEEKPDEIIVVDNNCTDKTISIVKNFKKVRIVREIKQGIAHARNAGFNQATGEIIARCDADTIMPSDWIKKLKVDFSSNSKIIAVTPSFYLYDTPLVKRSLMPEKIFYFFSRLIIGIDSLVGPSMAVRRSGWELVKDQVCSNDDDVHEDIDLAIHISKYGHIYLDSSIRINMSGRRIKFNPLSFFGEYPLLLIKMLYTHRKLISYN